ncbi:hydroxymethylglutaryl-CoA lyase [Flavobacteriaceae bacterium Ap0902]|nr:hydroxymethylglutaryl-CoA lyase [Flavobacteriaceae bacterium Ap0902]
MQGRKSFIPTEDKVKYIQSLIEVNFDILDCGSFVSPKAIPQMADSKEVLNQLDKSGSDTKLSVIVANLGGAQRAIEVENVDILGFPFSISEEFQLSNTNATREEGLERISEIKEVSDAAGKELLIYTSMGFGNPYGEEWSTDLLKHYVRIIHNMGIRHIKLSDTIGAAKPEDIKTVFSELIPKYPDVKFAAHFHTVYDEWFEKVNIAYENGCRDFDGAIQGYGGCPLSKTDLVGNMPTEKLISFVESKKEKSQINPLAFESAFNNALTIFL